MAGSSFKLGKPKSSVNTIVSSGGTTTLLNNSDFYQYVTGTLTQTIQLPDATTMPIPSGFAIANASTSIVIVVDAGNNMLANITSGLSAEFAIDNNSTSNGIWMSLTGYPSTPFITATGGIITTDGNYKIHVFNSNGTFQITSGSGDVQYLMVAGGGGGGLGSGGGGGAGGLLPGTVTGLGVGSYPIGVGAGGAGGTSFGGVAGDGIDSTFNGFTAFGGGGASSSNSLNVPGNNGGSGGGSGYSNQTSHSLGTVGQGHDGGLAFASAPNDCSGGGGGAGSAGADATSSVSGNGGAGLASSITGSAQFYAGGGGGGSAFGTPGNGGSGGGGNGNGGSNNGAPGFPGTANTGGGGGGASNPGGIGGAGGSGVVILRYQFQ